MAGGGELKHDHLDGVLHDVWINNKQDLGLPKVHVELYTGGMRGVVGINDRSPAIKKVMAKYRRGETNATLGT